MDNLKEMQNNGGNKVINFIKNLLLKIKGYILFAYYFVSFWLKKIKVPAFMQTRRFARFVIILVVLVSIAEIVFGVLIYKNKASDKITRAVAKAVPFPVAVVDYDVITYGQYLNEKDYIYHFYESTKQTDIDYGEIDKQVLNQLVENRLIAFEARLNRISLSKSERNAAFEDIIDQNGGQDSVNKVLSDLYGIDLKKFRNLVETQLLRDKVSSDLIEKVTVKHILVRVDANAPDDKVNEAKTKIDTYLNEIKNGADFNEEAKKFSEDIGSAEQGGQLEPFAQGEMVDAFSKVAFSIPIGQISDPVRTEFGWHIIKVESKTGKIEKSFVDWLNDIKKNSLIIKLI